jgi:chorismate mutase
LHFFYGNETTINSTAALVYVYFFMYNRCSKLTGRMVTLMNLLSLRGAITADDNTTESIDRASLELMQVLIEKNHLEEEQVVNVLFTATADLTARYPSIVLRNVLGWHQTAMLNFEEKVVTGQLPLCIRVLITLQTDQEKKSLRHAYLKGASVLRPDWTPEQEDSRQ